MPDEQPPRETAERRRLDSKALLTKVLEAKRAVREEHEEYARERQHEKGKLTARERIDYLLDDGTFSEVGTLAAPTETSGDLDDLGRDDAPADGFVTGYGEVDGRYVAVLASDFSVLGGSMGETGRKKMVRLMNVATDRGFPLVMLWDSGGHRIEEGLDAGAFGESIADATFDIQTKMSGWVPMLSAMLGPGFAGPTNFAAMADFVPMVDGIGTMGIAGPALVKAAIGLELTPEELGGARFHTVETGMADLATEDEEACLDAIKRFLSYFPQNAKHQPPPIDDWNPPYQEQQENLLQIVPADPKKGYSVQEVIEGIVDRNSFFEMKPRYAQNVVIGFARIEGKSVGVIANNPNIMAGTFDVDASEKASRFISMCDAFRIPLVFLADVPGIMPGPDSEREGIARHSGKLVYEIGRATVPKLNIVIRRGYGVGYLCMAAGRSTENELSVAWPTAEVAAMSIEGAVDIVYRREIEDAEDSEQHREDLIRKFTDQTGAIRAAETFGIDEVIDPRKTREWLANGLEWSRETKHRDWPPKKHGINPI